MGREGVGGEECCVEECFVEGGSERGGVMWGGWSGRGGVLCGRMEVWEAVWG